MARDLFQEYGVVPASAPAQGGGRDLFAEFGVQVKPETFNPTEGNSFLQNSMIGAGKAVVDTGRGVRQLLSKIGIGDEKAIQQEIDDAKERDKAVMGTGGGLVGNIGGQIATALLPGAALTKGGQALMAVPRLGQIGSGLAAAGQALTAPASIKAAAMAGGALGAVQPVASDDMGRLANIAFGAGGAAAGQYAGGKIANWLDTRSKEKLAELLAKQSQNSVKDATLATAKEAGYVVPPSMQDGGFIARAAEGLSGKYKTNQLAGIRNQKVTDSLARQALGLPEDAPLTSEAMQALRARAFQSGYEPVAGAGKVVTDDAYKAAMDAIVSKYQGAAADFPGVASTSVSDFINGNGKAAVSAPRSAWVDSAGSVVSDDVVPKMPKIRNLLEEIKRAGGVSVGEHGELGQGINKAAPGLLNKKSGMSSDSLAEWMVQNGWISKADATFADQNLTGGAPELARDMLRSALDKETVVHPANSSRWFEFQDAMKYMDDAGVKRVTLPGEQVPGGMRVPSFDAGNGLKMSQILRGEADAAFRAGDNALGKAKKEAAKAIEDQIERHLASDGGAGAEAADMLKNFRDARKLIAKSHDVEKAIKEGGGNVDATKLAAMLQRGKPLSDELRTIAAFANNFRDVANVPKSGHANPFTVLDFGTAGLGYGVSPYAALMPLGRVAARHAILSGPAQRAMGPQYEMSMLAKLLADPNTQMAIRRGAMPASLAGALQAAQE